MITKILILIFWNYFYIQVSEQETEWRSQARDYKDVYRGHCNITTDIKEAVFLGKDAQFIAAGSDDGNLFIWDRYTTNLLRVLQGDDSIVNCVQAHPHSCLLATSGIESCVKLWAPVPVADDEPIKDWGLNIDKVGPIVLHYNQVFNNITIKE